MLQRLILHPRQLLTLRVITWGVAAADFKVVKNTKKNRRVSQ